jgi:hypothetical protein
VSRLPGRQIAKKIAYVDSSELRIVSVTTGKIDIVPKINGLFPTSRGVFWSPDGKYLVFFNYDGDDHITFISDKDHQQIKLPISDDLSSWQDPSELWGWNKLLEFKIGRNYIVTPLGKGLILREEPSADARVIIDLATGDQVQFIGGPVNADFFTWWKVKVGVILGWVQVQTYWFDPL